MTKLGQHFLTNKSVLQKIADEAVKASPQTIIEIGPGHGELTSAMREASSVKNRTIKIIAVEKDSKLVAQLQEKFKKQSNVEIIAGDIRVFLPRYASRDSRYAIVGNIPYYLTGYLFRLIGELEKKPQVCVFTVQKEVAERLAAKPPSMNRLAAAVQYWAKVKILFYVGRSDFSPPPEVDSALIRLTIKPPKDNKSAKRYFPFIQNLFAAPRKTILNNLAGKMAAASRAKLEKEIRRGGINPALRPQNLKIEDIETLAEHLAGEL
jgi:16S rRNA (adenine1518-N6/adenine1519-N6)-dimethyltransferase